MSIAENIAIVREKIHEAEHNAGRASSSVQLMAVSKFHSSESINEAIKEGMHLFGENRVQEACEKFPSILAEQKAVKVHLIGALQRNKVKRIIPIASCIQSVDRSELLVEINKEARAAGVIMPFLFEYHTGEDSKSGYIDRDSLFRSIDLLEGMGSLRCDGLMTIAPFTPVTEMVRRSFRELVSVQQECIKRYPSLSFTVLSMGMSNDFNIAIEEGSTLIRVGTAIFGDRT